MSYDEDIQYLMRMERQRNELLTACESAKATLSAFGELYTVLPHGFYETIKELNQAIRKAKGEAK